MAITTRWWWVRHAPVINSRPELYGHKDLDCTLADEAALARLAEWLPADAVWVTSHLKRAIATAEAVRARMVERGLAERGTNQTGARMVERGLAERGTDQTGARMTARAGEAAAGRDEGRAAPALPEPIVDRAFAEQNFGDWEGLSFDELKDWLGAGFEAFWKAPAKVAAPAGESFADVIARVADGVARVNEAHAGRNIVAVAHGGSIRAALAHALSLDPDAALTFRIDNLSLTVIEHIRPDTGTFERGARTTWRVASVNAGLNNGVKEW